MQRARTTVTALLSVIAASTLVVAAPGVAHAASGPTIAITAPGNGDIVRGTVSVSYSAATDPALSDAPQTVQLYIDGAVQASDSCFSGTSTCAGTFTWDSTGHPGSHTLKAQVFTQQGQSASSTPVTIAVFGPASIQFTTPRSIPAGALATVKGRLLDAGGAPLVGRRVSVQATQALGASMSASSVTDASGGFAVSFLARSTTRVAASFSGEAAYGNATGSVSQAVLAPATCAVPSLVHLGGRFTIACRASSLPAGVRLTAQELVAGRWRNVYSWTSKGSAFGLVVTYRTRSVHNIRLILAGNKVYASTTTRGYRIKVV